MSRNRGWGAAALGRCGSREAAEISVRAVILRGVHAPKDLQAALPGSTHLWSDDDHTVGQPQGRPEMLRELKLPQDDKQRVTARRPEAGFTLIELLVVIAVIAILAGLVAPQVFSNVGDARSTAARAQIENFGLALDAYRLDNHQYPATEQGLAALMVPPNGEPVPANWRGPYLRRALPNDPWGHPYIYRCPGDSVPNGYDLLSLGRDGKAGGTGEDQDVTSWGATTR